ncbi:MAG: hypothetical protein EP333_05905 [Bacteroidetes bacterium]|nr:MAG: hypothetical protein EP333_05905 [Bacteroidota bacterium]TNF01026.1 MAG: hypothetical protein EP322_00430 [Bacteroidota bacterium]
MKILYYLIAGMLLLSCGQEEQEKVNEVKPTEPEELVEISNNIYREYYPGKKQVKFEGMQDDDKQRHGKWSFYNEKGIEITVTYYDHGKKHGHSIVKYPNGVVYYYGEYQNDKMVGVWKTFDENGKLITEKDYGYPTKN